MPIATTSTSTSPGPTIPIESIALPVPYIYGLSPSWGPTTGGTLMVIYGERLLGVTAVDFEGVPATSFNVISDSEIVAVAPAHAAGIADVWLHGPGGVSNSSPGANNFHYQEVDSTSATVALGTPGAPTATTESAGIVSTPTVTAESAGIVTTPVAESGPEDRGLCGGWIAFIILAAFDVLGGMVVLGYLLGKRGKRGDSKA